MTQIVRRFDNSSSARSATDELKSRGFGTVEMIDIPAERRGNGGGAVVRVEAPFGTATLATAILDKHGGRDAGREAAPPPRAAAVEPAAPASANRQAAQTDAHSHGSHEGLRSGPRTLSELLGIPELISSNAFFSGFPLLIRPKPVTGGTLSAGDGHASHRSADPARSSDDRSRSAFIRNGADRANDFTKTEPITLGARPQRRASR